MLGFNYRMTDMQTALGHAQLQRLEKFIERRRAIATFYDGRFAGLQNVTVPQSAPDQRRR